MGTTLEDRGLDVKTPLWSSAGLLDDGGRALNDAVHADFAKAGAEIIIANTHNASLAASALYFKEGHAAPPGFDTPRKLQALVCWEAMQSLRRSLGEAPAQVIAGCLGSAELAYAKTGKYTKEEIAERHATHAAILAACPIDLLLFEALSTKSEVEGVPLAMAKVRETYPDLPLGVGFTCDATGKTHGGVSMRDAVRAFKAVKPDLYFVQCTRYDLVERPYAEMLDALGHAHNTGVYANDGRTWKDRAWHGERVSPQKYADSAARWVELGATVIGGCCGTGPEHVSALARLRDEKRR